MDPIMQFMISLRSVPGWLLPYTTSPKGSLQWVLVTMKVKESRANYLSFLAKLNSILPASQRKPLEYVFFLSHIDVAKPIHPFDQSFRGPSSLGKEMQHHVGDLIPPNYLFSDIKSSKSEVTALNIRLPNFQAFSSPDLKCLKDDKSWLTDSHVTFCLLFVPFLFCRMKLNRLLWLGTVI